MNKFKVIIYFILIITSCQSKVNLIPNTNSKINLTSPAYFEKWVAGVEGGGSGINVFLPVKNSTLIQFDSIHFRGHRVKVSYRNNMVIGRFKSNRNTLDEVILRSDIDDEKKNNSFKLNDNSHFKLSRNSCILSYRFQGNRMYREFKNLKYNSSKPYPAPRIK